MGNANCKKQRGEKLEYEDTVQRAIANEENAMWQEKDPEEANLNQGWDRDDSCSSETFVIEKLPGMMSNVGIRVVMGRDRHRTVVQETEKLVVMKTPLMRATAHITIPPMEQYYHWEIGWVQACYYLKFCNSYGTMGFSSWEFPELNSGKMAVNDSSGRYFPFYGDGSEVVTIKGPSKQSRKYSVTLTDAPMSQITLKVPMLHYKTRQSCDLTSVRRNQKFNLWLIARDMNTNDVYPLRTMSWDVDINISVDPDRPVGYRAKLLEPKHQQKPHMLDHILSVPEEALLPPDANRAQMLVWRPKNQKESVAIVVAPRHNHMPTLKQLHNPAVYRKSIE